MFTITTDIGGGSPAVSICSLLRLRPGIDSTTTCSRIDSPAATWMRRRTLGAAKNDDIAGDRYGDAHPRQGMPAESLEEGRDHERDDRHHHANVARARRADAAEQRQERPEGEHRAEHHEVEE